MLKSLIFISMLVTHAANAEERLLCTDTGDLNGSYILDITGYEKILDGSQESMVRSLGFKYFRSWVTKIAEFGCAQPNPYLEGPLTLMACYSGPISDYGQAAAPFEAAISNGNSGLIMTVRGPGIPAGYSVPCQIKESKESK
jgi:hypothetical protein